MTLLATLIAIAAWCGQPIVVSQHGNTFEYKYYTAQEVNQCRQELRDCLQKHPKDAQCFLDQRLGK